MEEKKQIEGGKKSFVHRVIKVSVTWHPNIVVPRYFIENWTGSLAYN